MSGSFYDPPSSASNLSAYVKTTDITANMASTPPPSVAQASDVGASNSFARGDHTHKSSVQTKRLTLTTLTGGSAIITWTFDTPFANGVVPTVLATAENLSGATQPLVVNLYGTPTNTQAQFIVFKGQTTTLGSTLLAIAGSVISPFTSASVNTVINCWAHV